MDGGQTYGQVAFSYEEQVPQNEESEKVSGKIEEEEEEEPFVPPPELDVPVNMTLASYLCIYKNLFTLIEELIV